MPKILFFKTCINCSVLINNSNITSLILAFGFLSLSSIQIFNLVDFLIVLTIALELCFYKKYKNLSTT